MVSSAHRSQGGILVCLSRYNKTPWTGWLGSLNNSHLFVTVLETVKSEIKVLADSVPSRRARVGDALPGPISIYHHFGVRVLTYEIWGNPSRSVCNRRPPECADQWQNNLPGNLLLVTKKVTKFGSWIVLNGGTTMAPALAASPPLTTGVNLKLTG